jgi:hypothetical protein
MRFKFCNVEITSSFLILVSSQISLQHKYWVEDVHLLALLPTSPTCSTPCPHEQDTSQHLVWREYHQQNLGCFNFSSMYTHSLHKLYNGENISAACFHVLSPKQNGFCTTLVFRNTQCRMLKVFHCSSKHYSGHLQGKCLFGGGQKPLYRCGNGQ